MKIPTTLIRLLGIISVLSIVSGYARYPESVFITSCVMVVVWIHKEYEIRFME